MSQQMYYQNPTEAFESLFRFVKYYGQDYAGTRARFNISFEILRPYEKVITTPKRKFNEEYAEYEWNWYLTGNRDASEISEKAKIWKNMMVPGTTEVNSNYGYFWNYNGQLDKAIELLKQKDNRRAIVVHYDINELDRYQYDTPCNDILNFYIADGKLQLTVFARSIDLVYGFCNDQYTFAKLMEMVASKLGVDVGKMHWFITNLHIYPRHYDLL